MMLSLHNQIQPLNLKLHLETEFHLKDSTLIMSMSQVMKQTQLFHILTITILAGKQMYASFKSIMLNMDLIVMNLNWPKLLQINQRKRGQLKVNLRKKRRKKQRQRLRLKFLEKKLIRLKKHWNQHNSGPKIIKTQMTSQTIFYLNLLNMETSKDITSQVQSEIKDHVVHVTLFRSLKLLNQDLR